MFCSECGTKNDEKSLYCESCGHKLEQEVKTKEKKEIQEPKKVKEKKKNKPIKYLLGLIIIVLIGGYLYLSDITNPKKIAEGYFNAIVDMDTNKLYDYMDISNSEFTTKKIFKKILKESDIEIDIINYTVGNPEVSSDKLSTSITITYLLKDTEESETMTVKLVKEKTKKWLFFDNWKVSTDGTTTISNYEFELPKDSKLEIEGIKVDKKYVSDSTDTLDTYIIPTMFASDYNIKVTLPMGLELEEKVNVNDYYDYSVELTEENISDELKESLQEASKTSLENLYNNAKDKKAWSEVKSLFEYKGVDVTNIKTSYEELVSEFSNIDSTITNITFKEISLDDVSIDDDGYLYLEIEATYDYSLTYLSGEETKTNSSSDYDYVYLNFDYKDGEFKLVNATSLNTYFSKYY